jgi:hypothetical protein
MQTKKKCICNKIIIFYFQLCYILTVWMQIFYLIYNWFNYLFYY